VSRWRRTLLGLLLAGVTLALLWTARVPLLKGMGRWLDVGTAPRRCDYVMLLTGDEPTRPFAAALLVKDHLAPRVLVAGTAARQYRVVPPSSEIGRQVLIRRGVKPSQITTLPGEADTTFDEARALAAFLADKPKETRVTVITSDYHARRSRWIFRRVFGDRAAALSFVSAPSDDFSLDDWWRNECGWMAIIAEYLKFAFYLFAYGHFLPWLAACAGLVLVVKCARRRQSTR
jgi:uncharacterized SAM-binding protein YcdF (DUF218 family)